MGRTVGRGRGAKWALIAVLATGAVVGGVAFMTAPADEYPAGEGWIREPAPSKAALRAAGDPSQAAVSAELAAAAAAAGIAAGPVHPSGGDEDGHGTADCIADWTGDGPADEARLAALETALEERGWQVVARRGSPFREVALSSGSWRLELHNGGLMNTATLVARRSTEPCEEAFRRAEETRGPRG
ncbi:hypothetical protein ADK75_15335 [Streptomyces virginiae]|uniref:Lipoprotein n=1 Tax=Streptomyces virginiae TaxID=1961 RepID=A0A0L8MRS4_STRVG|nr:hypothetical protein [Streptomyces virginiae]KOG53097.1 hypothetical protein ADK75_15335 [Streptomyces virginiae]